MSVEKNAVNTIRFLAVDAVEKAQSGHPGLPMGGATMGYTLWSKFLKHDPRDPAWPDRDRFVLSAGHGSMLLYSLLHLFGYDLSMEEIKNFRQWDSKTPGHPEFGHTPGVETTTGPLGQGFANAVGMAIAEQRLGAEFNQPDLKIVDHYTYVYAGDGCMMEGITSEAASLAGHLGLGKLICFYDDNEITIDGSTELAFTEEVEKRFKAFDWQVLRVKDGQDIDEITRTIAEGKSNSKQPTLIMVKTKIGYGSPAMEGTAAAHGAPLGAEEVKATKENLGWPVDKEFYIPREVEEHFSELQDKLKTVKKDWAERWEEYKKRYPEKARDWKRWHDPRLPEELKRGNLVQFSDKLATRAASGEVMQEIAGFLPNLMGGSADLNASTKTYLKGKGDFTKENRSGNNIYFGVREHAMAGIVNGFTLHGGIRPFASTFLVFADYMKPSIRLAALSRIPVVFVFTHDSIGVGEDGPTHQPIEHLAMLRSLPNLDVLRPADGKETEIAWIKALQRQDGPTALVLTRQKLPQLEGSSPDAGRGAYIVAETKGKDPEIILMASGSEVSLIIEAKERLEQEGRAVRAVSFMSWELFERQPREYQEKVLPSEITKRLAVEAAQPMGWERYVGPEGLIWGIDEFGASAPGDIVMEKKGFTPENITRLAKEILG